MAETLGTVGPASAFVACHGRCEGTFNPHRPVARQAHGESDARAPCVNGRGRRRRTGAGGARGAGGGWQAKIGGGGGTPKPKPELGLDQPAPRLLEL